MWPDDGSPDSPQGNDREGCVWAPTSVRPAHRQPQTRVDEFKTPIVDQTHLQQGPKNKTKQKTIETEKCLPEAFLGVFYDGDSKRVEGS